MFPYDESKFDNSPNTLNTCKNYNTGRFCRYVVDGVPVPLARVRFGNKRCWDSQKDLKLIVGCQLEQQHRPYKPFCVPIALDVTFFMKKPKRLKNLHHVTKPDLSNLIKFIEDAGNGIIYTDDRLIFSINARKIYSNIPRTELLIYFEI